MKSPTTAYPWQPTRFFLAIPGRGATEAWGYEHQGLALRHSGWAEPRTNTKWSLVHIGSGGTIMRLVGSVSMVMPVASEIAECSDWTLFDLPEGWRQTDPDLPAKVGAICEAHPEVKPDTSFAATEISDTDARAVIDAREAASVN